MKPFAAFVLLLSLPVWAKPEIADSSPAGFTVKSTLTVKASPISVYRTLVDDVGEWWDSSHTFSGNAHNLSIDEQPGGCFCEMLPDAGGVRHMAVINFAPGRTLVMSGALGPLQPLAATGTMTVKLTPADAGGTKLEVTYAVAGYLSTGMNALAAPVDGVVALLFTRLKNYAEHGNPAPAH